MQKGKQSPEWNIDFQESHFVTCRNASARSATLMMVFHRQTKAFMMKNNRIFE